MIARLQNPRVSSATATCACDDLWRRRRPATFLALINSFGVLEIAWREGNAADRCSRWAHRRRQYTVDRHSRVDECG